MAQGSASLTEFAGLIQSATGVNVTVTVPASNSHSASPSSTQVGVGNVGSSGAATGAIIGATVGGIAAIVLIGLVAMTQTNKRRQSKNTSNTKEIKDSANLQSPLVINSSKSWRQPFRSVKPILSLTPSNVKAAFAPGLRTYYHSASFSILVPAAAYRSSNRLPPSPLRLSNPAFLFVASVRLTNQL